jgi:hypothetical protein
VHPRSGCSGTASSSCTGSPATTTTGSSAAAFLPELDLALIARLAAYPDQQDALDELRRLLG